MFSLQFIVLLCLVALAKQAVRIDLSSLDERAIGTPNEKTGELVANWKPTDGVNPEELGEYQEGDILFLPSYARNGLSPESTRWPNGIIPFEIKGGFGMLIQSKKLVDNTR